MWSFSLGRIFLAACSAIDGRLTALDLRPICSDSGRAVLRIGGYMMRMLSETDAFRATGRAPHRSDQLQPSATKRLRRHSDAPRDGVLDTRAR